MKRTVEFYSLQDLQNKLDILKGIYSLVNTLNKDSLIQRGIPYHQFGDTGILVDVKDIPEGETMETLRNPTAKTIMENAHQSLKVTVLE